MASAIRKLFGLDKNRPAASGEIPTIPISKISDANSLEAAAKDTPRIEHPQTEIGFGYSVGRQRDHNEDSFLVIQSDLATNGEIIPFGLYVVADGMGGHKQGEVASGLAIRAIASEIVKKVMLALIAPQPAPPEAAIPEVKPQHR